MDYYPDLIFIVKCLSYKCCHIFHYRHSLINPHFLNTLTHKINHHFIGGILFRLDLVIRLPNFSTTRFQFFYHAGNSFLF